ncbi:type III pantothenate kinase [candidate division WOR-3 bacterium]|nr:type III pantothenate kinase [candidate division WOR-3 bacterium]
MECDDRKIVCIDIGNSATSIGLFDVVTVREPPLLANPQRISNKKLGDIKSWLLPINRDFRFTPTNDKVSAVMIASVVPEKNEVFRCVIQGVYGIAPKFVDSSLIKRAYSELGADRVANLIGGYEKFGLPVCVIDFGSAITIDVLKQATGKRQKAKVDGEYGGGVILPGVEMGLKVLHQDTSLLPEVSFVGTIRELPLLGKSTIECIKSSSYWGELCRIQGLIEKIKQDLNPKIVCTGGAGELFAKALGLKYEPWLTLWGLYFIWKKSV